MKPQRIHPELLLLSREDKYTLQELCEAFGFLIKELELSGYQQAFIFEEAGRIVCESLLRNMVSTRTSCCPHVYRVGRLRARKRPR
jgi:hypothetical protein